MNEYFEDDQAFNRAQLFAVENVAALGIGTARGLASIPEAVMRVR
ncbi:unnamed protein product [Anisakis simplex]|uniref:Phosphoenolpyruvate synthase n=1 Tax=Anisakis simplex TaxID=6269 RepID=A0A0M3JP93_ANISI|nr:unnamed protein product [Anisakis simplex]